MSMTDGAVTLFERAFANTIAFLLPGLITLFGIATVNDTVRGWFQGAQNGPTLVGLLFVLLAALGLNIGITALRYCIFETRWLPWLGCPWVPPSPALQLANRRLHEAQYLDLRHQHYYHYLASSNMAVAIPLAVIAWKLGSRPAPTWEILLTTCVVAALVTAALSAAGLNACALYDKRRAELLATPMPTAAPTT